MSSVAQRSTRAQRDDVILLDIAVNDVAGTFLDWWNAYVERDTGYL